MLFHARVLSLFLFLTHVRALDENETLDMLMANRDKQVELSSQAITFYFAYGSNMLEKRLKAKCPNAKLFGAALLKNHRLDFTMEAPWWNGAVATICQDPNADVWGVLWVIRITDLDKLDEQEGVSAGWYHSKEVIVEYGGAQKMKAITYVQNHSPRKLGPTDYLPPERQPSITYLKVMILGAIQGGIPDDYIQYLYSVRHNGRVASKDLIENFVHSRERPKHLLLK